MLASGSPAATTHFTRSFTALLSFHGTLELNDRPAAISQYCYTPLSSDSGGLAALCGWLFGAKLLVLWGMLALEIYFASA
jgi:hypothetical protein